MRYLLERIKEFSHQKYVLLAGPRQVGKTTLAKAWLEGRGTYLNWDISEDRPLILKKTFASQEPTQVVLDEIHKYARWKSFLKGLYDGWNKKFPVLVTGSARLDVFVKGGDSLFGRYERLRLHPYTIGEIVHGTLPPPPSNWLNPESVKSRDTSVIWDRLKRFSGFPEPYHQADPMQWNRWTHSRRNLLIGEDLRELSNIRSVSLVEHLFLLLPDRVGSPLSLNGLKEELSVAHDTVSNWMNLFERLYICFRLSPYSDKISRSLKREQKCYLWNWADIQDSSKLFENMVASHLLKAVHAWTDVGYGNFELHYWRDKDKREVDFIVTESRKPIVAIECKETSKGVPKSMYDFESKLNRKIPKIVLTAEAGVHNKGRETLEVSAQDYFLSFP